MVQHVKSAGGSSFSEMTLSQLSSFFKEQRVLVTLELKQQQKEMDARLDAKDAKMEQDLAMLKTELTPAPAITDEQLTAPSPVNIYVIQIHSPLF